MKARSEAVRWTDSEWDRFADIVFAMRINSLRPALSVLMKKAMQNMSTERRRSINLDQMPQLMSRLEKKVEEHKNCVRRTAEMEKKLSEVKTAEELLEELSDSEISRLYGERFLSTMTPDELLSGLTTAELFESMKTEDLVAEAARRLASEMLMNSAGIRQIVVEATDRVETVLPLRTKMPKIIIVGCKGDQHQIVRGALSHLCDLKFIDSGQVPRIPTGGDIYVGWVRFVNHSDTDTCKKYSPPGNYIQHVGGVGKMIESVKNLLTQKFYQKT